jgi:hypothetical protein
MPGDDGIDDRGVVVGDGAEAVQFREAANQVLPP